MTAFITVMMIIMIIYIAVSTSVLFKILKRVNDLEVDETEVEFDTVSSDTVAEDSDSETEDSDSETEDSDSETEDSVSEADLIKIGEILDQIVDLGNKIEESNQEFKEAQEQSVKLLIKGFSNLADAVADNWHYQG